MDTLRLVTTAPQDPDDINDIQDAAVNQMTSTARHALEGCISGTAWRAERVGTSGWVLDEVSRITGVTPAPVLEFPRQSGRWGFGRWDDGRWGRGPVIIVGAEPMHRAELEATLEAGVPPHVGIIYLAPDVFDAIINPP